jgi:Lrp/AsnC family transcriptional regulator, leucine-responsive regulatory protein
MDGIVVYDIEQKVDKKDRKILKVLFEDGRMSIANIAKKTNLRRDSISRRIKNLIKNKILRGFVPVINGPALGLPNTAILLFKLNISDNKEQFVKKLVANKFLVHVSELLGNFDIYGAVLYKNTNHLNTIVKEIKEYVPNIIQNLEIYPVVNDPKFERMDDLL